MGPAPIPRRGGDQPRLPRLAVPPEAKRSALLRIPELPRRSRAVRAPRGVRPALRAPAGVAARLRDAHGLLGPGQAQARPRETSPSPATPTTTASPTSTARSGRCWTSSSAGACSGTPLVIITSDHGEEFGEHGVFNHGYSLYLQEVHVPLVVIPPSTSADGTRRLRTGQPARPAGDGRRSVGPLGRLASPFPGRSLASLWDPAAEPPRREPPHRPSPRSPSPWCSTPDAAAGRPSRGSRCR